MLDDYKKRTPRSREFWERAIRVFAGGINHNIRTFCMDRVGAYPPYITRGEGSHVWDVDGNEYVDWWMTHYAQILGHSNPVVKSALIERIQHGHHFGALNEEMVGLAERIIDAIPYMKKMRFCSTGAEATMYAVRLARLFTKKRLVAKVFGGWHGGNDTVGYHVSYPFNDAPFYDGVTFNFNDPDSADILFKQFGPDIAAVIVEPILGAGGALAPEPGFLEFLREQTERLGAILIFDEIITGFRFRYGTVGKALFGVEPDLTTLGKVAGGGMHLGVYGGREDIMALAEPGAKGGRWVGGGTFSSHPLSMVAGSATLDELRKRADKYPALNKKGEEFRVRVNQIFQEQDFKAVSTGYGSLTYIHCLHKELGAPPYSGFTIGEAFDHNLMDRFQSLLMQEGVIGYHGLGAMSFAHTPEDIEYTLKAIENVVTQIKH